MIIFRKINQEYIKDIVDIEQECFMSPWSEEQLISELSNNPFSRMLALYEDNTCKGFIIYWVTFDSATICQIGVKKEFRRNHLGFKLMEEAFKEMDKEEVSTISLEVRVTNEPAIKFYEKIGFKKITIKEHYYDDGEDAIYMVKGGTNIWDNQ